MLVFFPIWKWLQAYSSEDLKGDLNSGLTVAVVLIPQGMAYGMLAGVPPVVGLYAAVLPLIVYGIFGTSRYLAVGPVAMDSLLVAAGISKLTEAGSDQYLAMAIVLAAMVGIFQLIMGVARLGFLVNFIAHPVVSGFTSAAALIIGFSQIKYLLGIDIPRTFYVHEIMLKIVDSIAAVNLPTLGIGLLSILLLLLIKHWNPLLPGALIVVVISTLAVWLLRLDALGVEIVGKVPEGLPAFRLPDFELGMVETLLPLSVTLAMIGYMEAIAIAKALAIKDRETVDPNQELISIGLANLASSLSGSYPVTGGFSRTAVRAQAGSRTGMSSIISGISVGVILLLFIPLIHYLPTAALAAIIIVGVSGLIDTKAVKYLYQVKRSDLLLLILAFVSTLALGIEYGIILSVAASLILVIHRTTNPHYAYLGRLPGTQIYRNTERYPEARTIPGLAILRIDMSLYFANIEFLKDRIHEIQMSHQGSLRAILFDASSVNSIDSSADSALHEIASELKANGVEFFFANIKGPVRDVMKRSGFYDFLGADHFFFSNHDAVRKFLGQEPSLGHEGPGRPAPHSHPKSHS